MSVLHEAGGVTIDGASYEYDNAGNRTSKTNYLNNTVEDYTYDAIYQLTQVTRNGQTSEAYTYDEVGNRLSSLGLSPWTFNDSNQLLSTPATTFAYDNNGNTTSKTDTNGTTSYAWDYENRLTSVTLPGEGGVVTFKYDPFGRRIQKSGPLGTTNYVYDGANIVAEYDASGAVLARYAQGAGIDEPLAMSRSGALSFYDADGLSSITSLANGSGTVVQNYVTDAFGKEISATGGVTNRFRYTGREWDTETGLYYYRARYYSPETGRFLSEDPITFDGGINFYTYVGNSPTNTTDPFGLCDPTKDIKNCLEKVFAKPIDKVVVHEKIKPPDYPWGATTRKNNITIFIPCQTFFSDPDTYLEEYYHVLEQWNTGRLSRLKYAVEYARHGYDKNKYEIEAKEWVKQHIQEFKQCLECNQSAK